MMIIRSSRLYQIIFEHVVAYFDIYKDCKFTSPLLFRLKYYIQIEAWGLRNIWNTLGSPPFRFSLSMGHFVNPSPSPIWWFCQSTPHPNPSHSYLPWARVLWRFYRIIQDPPSHLALLTDPLWSRLTGSNGPPWPHLVSLPDLLGACFTVPKWTPLILSGASARPLFGNPFHGIRWIPLAMPGVSAGSSPSS